MDAKHVIVALLTQRAATATVCPSEVARALAAGDGNAAEWRAQMPKVHAAVDQMVGDGQVGLSWKGERMPTRKGAYRIHRGLPGH